MTISLIIIASLISASLFDALPILKTTRLVFNLQKESLKVIMDSRLRDEQKQKILLSLSGKILYTTIKLVMLVLIAVLPFIGLVFIGHCISEQSNLIDIVVSLKGICLTCLTFLLYYLIKKGIGKFRI
jgi:hypothetical protein